MKVKITRIIKGENLRYLLLKNDITKAELARKLGVHRSYLGKIEKGQVPITEKLYKRIISLLDKEISPKKAIDFLLAQV